MTQFSSLCILSFERPLFLKACLETVRDAGEPVEIIVHDDGSQNPQVHEFLIEMYRRGQISTLIMNPPGHNQGVGCAIKRMFDVAQGDILWKVDQDLVFQTGWGKTARKMFKDPDLGLAGLFKYHVEPCIWTENKIEVPSPPKTHTYHEYIVGSAFGITRETYEEFGIGIHSTAFAEDYMLMKAINESGKYCGLPTDDLCMNVGFGLGPSTVVTQVEPVYTTQPIHQEPILFGK